MSNENKIETVEGVVVREYDIEEYDSEMRKAISAKIVARNLDGGHYKLIKTE